VDAAMPARYVRGGEPRSLLITGDKDSRVSPQNQARLVARLKAVGSPVEDRHFPELTHTSLIARLASPWRDDALLDLIADFVKR
jgi:acetyl esterase/lipase